jgi:hypothetical protein
VAEALLDAESAVKRLPESALLRRRRAQAHLCRTIQWDIDLADTLQDIRYSPFLSKAVSFFQRLKANPNLHKPRPGQAQWEDDFARLEAVITGPVIKEYQEQAQTKLASLRPSFEQRNYSLSEVMKDLAEARKLGDTGVELALTDLWAQVMVLYGQQVLRESDIPNQSKAPNTGYSDERAALQLQITGLRKGLSAFDQITRDSVLRAAVDLTRRHPNDPVAMAGAADVIAVAASIATRPDRLSEYIRQTLNRAYQAKTDKSSPAKSPVSIAAARDLYTQARDAKDPNVVSAPSAVVLQLYRRALAADGEGTLPFLRLRLYLFQVLFEPERAVELLNDVQRMEPRNAAIPLERARAAFLIKADPSEGLAWCREVARLREFSRSYLVAVPTPLRSVLKLHPRLRESIKNAWPGHSWLFGTIWHTQRVQRGQPERVELILLRLQIAERLCQAPDHADQAEGIHQKTLALNELAGLGEKLSREQRAMVMLQRQAHERAFAGFLRSTNTMLVSKHGMKRLGFPEVGPSTFGDEGPTLVITPSGTVWFAPDLRRKGG